MNLLYFYNSSISKLPTYFQYFFYIEFKIFYLCPQLGYDSRPMSSQYNRKDHLYNQAKSEGYRSRAAYKLVELNNKYKFIKKGSSILDLGAWPGGWLQIASKLIGDNGVAVGVDLVEIEPIVDAPNVKVITGDARDDSTIEQILSLVDGKFDIVLSDMSPKLSGIREVDSVASVACGEIALFVCEKVLKPSGVLVIKLFKSSESDQFIKQSRPRFEKIVRCELDSTRKTSNEFYFVGLNFKEREQ